METLEASLQKGIARALEQDLQQRGRTQEEMQQLSLEWTSEHDKDLLIFIIEERFKGVFRELLQRINKEFNQKWHHEGGRRDFAIEVILEIFRDRGQSDFEEKIRAFLQNIDDWKIIKKLVLLAPFMDDWCFAGYVALIQRVINSDERSRAGLIGDTRALIYMQLGEAVMEEITPGLQRIDDVEELYEVFIAAARAPNLGMFRQAHPALQHTKTVESPSSTQEEEPPAHA